jgi:serine/threonine-protein kinase RsbW
MSARARQTCRITVPARPDSLDEIHDLVESLWTGQEGFPQADRLRFETAVIEVAGNIVTHAVTRPEMTVELTLTATPEAATTRFRDDGGAARLDLAAARMPDTMAESGRGLALTRALADDVTYERVGSATVWTLTCLRRQQDR